MYKVREVLYLVSLTLLIMLTLCSYPLRAEEQIIYINGTDLTDELKPQLIDDQIVVNSRAFADNITAELKWFQSIKTLQITKDNTVIKIMANNPYIQINDKTYRSNASLIIKEGQSYIPLKEVAEGFGYLYRKEGTQVYVTKPEGYVEEIFWRQEGQQLVIKMNKLTPYRIANDDDPKKIVLEIDQAALAKDFKDSLSNKNFYLKVEKVINQARIRLIIISKYTIPFQRERGLEEDDNRLLINFLPSISKISWAKDKLEIKANGIIEKPEISLLHNPKRMVIDIHELMLSNYQLDLPQNQWIKEIRVSQFKYDPVILRVVLELFDDKNLTPVFQPGADKIILKPADINQVSNLAFYEGKIIFETNNPVDPDIFTLENPDRLVINLINTVRDSRIPDNFKVEDQLVKSIRTSRFDEETVRIVIDLTRFTGYNWRRKELSNGVFQHTIVLENQIETIKLVDQEIRTDLNVVFNASTDYQIKKVTNPERLILDIDGMVNNISADELPEPVGLVESIRISQLSTEPAVTRLVLEIDGEFDYKLYSANPGPEIALSLNKDYGDQQGDMQVENLGQVIVIDAGHGGFDPGAIGPTGIQEKDVNLAIVKKVNALLKDAGYKTLLTRSNDNFISLKERVTIANEIKAKLFISVHNNASNDKYTQGTETFIAPDKVGGSKLLAESIQQELISELKRPDRGVKKANLYVIKHTDMPAVLLEVAFLSNTHEESLLEGDLFREKAANAIFTGVINYLENIE